MKRNNLILIGIILLLHVALTSCQNKNLKILGKYNYYSEDVMAMQMMAGQNTYFKLEKNGQITYHTEINGKKTFNHEGVFSFNEKTNILSIEWKSGKVPNQLKVEIIGGDYLINVGSTTYKQENISE